MTGTQTNVSLTPQRSVGKHLGSYTLQGSVRVEADDHEVQQIRLFDGRFDTAYRVTYFRIVGNSVYSSTSGDCVAILSTRDLTGQVATTNPFDLEDQSQIGWAWHALAAESDVSFSEGFVNRDNLIIEDLWVNVRLRASTGTVGYYVELEKYRCGTDKGVLALIRNNQQDIDDSD